MNSGTFSRRCVFTIAVLVTSFFFFSSCKKSYVTPVSASVATITGFSPTSGSSGTTVIITGTNFSTVLAYNAVTFNGVHATVSAATVGQITTTVPAGATTGKIVVTVTGQNGSAMSSSNFTVD